MWPVKLSRHMPTHRQTHTDQKTTTWGSAVGGAGGIVLPVARGGLTPTPCWSDRVIGCLFLRQQSRATAPEKTLREMNKNLRWPLVQPHAHSKTCREKYFTMKQIMRSNDFVKDLCLDVMLMLKITEISKFILNILFTCSQKYHGHSHTLCS